jgi:hypothetical protein
MPQQSAAVTEGDRYRRPLQGAGGGDGSGRYINNALRQDASTRAVPCECCTAIDTRYLYWACAVVLLYHML